MQNTIEDIRRLEREFKACQKVLSALGDETRQHLLYIMIQGQCSGSRVVDIALQTNLSRPAVSHHMQILKDAGIVKSRKESTYILLLKSRGGSDQQPSHFVSRYPGDYKARS